MHRGKLLILAMLILGCLAAGVSIAYHRWQTRRAMAWWGHDAIEAIADAPTVFALRLRPVGSATDEPAAETITIDGVPYLIDRRKDVTEIEGIEHLRRGLLEDGNYDWDVAAPPKPPDWEFALEFRGPRVVRALFDFENQRIGHEQARAMEIAPVARGFEEFFGEHLGRRSAR